MVSLEGMITVAEAAKRLDRSLEQVRRYLREGKLRGQRIGGQWFVEEASLQRQARLLTQELIDEIDQTRDEIRKRHGTFDVVALVRKSREGH